MKSHSQTSQPRSNRRQFLGSIAATAASGAALIGSARPAHAAEMSGPDDMSSRKQKSYDMRLRSAEYFRNLPDPQHESNGDEKRYPDLRNTYTKSLPKDELGNVNREAFDLYMKAIESGKPEDWNNVRLGGPLKLKDPQAAYSWQMEGADSHQLKMRPAPAFASAEQAGEMVELYWHALARDVLFGQYSTDSVIRDACADLSRMSDFRGPKVAGRVTPETIFRGGFPGDLNGPWLSQFLLLPVVHGSVRMPQKQRTVAAGVDYLTQHQVWLDNQRGGATKDDRPDPTPRYIRNGRDVGEWVHRDYSYQGFLQAALILFDLGKEFFGGIQVVPTYSDNVPYLYSTNQQGFATFGGPDITELVARVSKFAFQAAWFQKWLIHRRARPEEIGGRVHNHMNRRAEYDFHADLLNSRALQLIGGSGSYLLSQAFQEGTPTHPAYPSGHATMSGACCTLLKAFFKEDFVFPEPVVASPDGLELLPYSGPPLTVGGELNKLASNIAIARNFTGIHWRTDASEGLRLGEQVAIHALRDIFACYTEDIGGFTFTKFDGTRILVNGNGAVPL